MTTFLSNDSKMLEAYKTSKDLYAMIAQSAYDNKYEENLEFWPEGTEIEIDGKKVIAGDNKDPIEVEISEENNCIELKRSNILDIVDKGEVQAAFLQVGDQTIEGPTITKIEPKNNKIIVYFDC